MLKGYRDHYAPTPSLRAGIRNQHDIEHRKQVAQRTLEHYEHIFSEEGGEEDIGMHEATINLLADLIHHDGEGFEERLKIARGHVTREQTRAKRER